MLSFVCLLCLLEFRATYQSGLPHPRAHTHTHTHTHIRFYFKFFNVILFLMEFFGSVIQHFIEKMKTLSRISLRFLWNAILIKIWQRVEGRRKNFPNLCFWDLWKLKTLQSFDIWKWAQFCRTSNEQLFCKVYWNWKFQEKEREKFRFGLWQHLIWNSFPSYFSSFRLSDVLCVDFHFLFRKKSLTIFSATDSPLIYIQKVGNREFWELEKGVNLYREN